MQTLSISCHAARPGIREPASRPWRRVSVAFLVAGTTALVAAAPADAAAIITAQATVCGGTTASPCVNGPGVLWTPPNGGGVSSSVSSAWTNLLSPGYTYSLTADAQSTISGPNHWTGNVRAGGYMNNGFYGSNGVNAISATYVEDDFVVHSTPTWNGPGFLTLTYHVTGAASVNYNYIGTNVSGDGRNVALAQLQFGCHSTAFGACTATGVPFIDTGLYRQAFTFSQSYDNLVTFMLPVWADVASLLQLDTFLTASMSLYGNADPGRIVGAAAADFSHTFDLVAADLLDSAYVPVPDWSITADSGFDYAHLAAVVAPPPIGGTVPEPATFALLGIGGLCAGFATRQRRRAPMPAR